MIRSFGCPETKAIHEHTFEIYEGNHTNHVAERIATKTLPFFSKNLAFR